jgi:hypothetical protein
LPTFVQIFSTIFGENQASLEQFLEKNVMCCLGFYGDQDTISNLIMAHENDEIMKTR